MVKRLKGLNPLMLPQMADCPLHSINNIEETTLGSVPKLVFVCFSAILCSCRPESFSSPRVTNGLLDLGDQGVFMIQGEEPGSVTPSRCTASLIRPRILLTAAHCVKNKKSGQDRTIRLASPAGLRSLEIIIHPEYRGQPRFDVAMVKLDGEVKNAVPMDFAAKLPQKGDQVKLVGFGGNQYTAIREIVTGSGVKRMGTTQISYLDDHFIYSRGIRDAMPQGLNKPTGSDVALAHGDSGGPMLDAEGVIIGIAARTNSETIDPKINLSIIVAHTQIAVVADFIKKYLESEDN